MKIAAMVCRILLGLLFLFAAAQGFFNFLHAQPMPAPAGDFINSMVTSHYVWGISLAEVVGGLLFLLGRYVRLGIVLLGPVIYNILLFHIFMNHQGLAIAMVIAALWFVVLAREWGYFRGLFAVKTSA